jgi:hypothetical protein
MRIFFLLLFLAQSVLIFAQSIGIKQSGFQLPDSSAILDLNRTSKGFLAPRLSSGQRNNIFKPATALLLFNSDVMQFQVNVGSPESPVWKNIASLNDSATNTLYSKTSSNSNLKAEVIFATKEKTPLKIASKNVVPLNTDPTVSKIGINTNTPQATLHINATDAIIIPVGTTAQRPTAPIIGMIRFNSSTSKLEGYTNSGWVAFQ